MAGLPEVSNVTELGEVQSPEAAPLRRLFPTRSPPHEGMRKQRTTQSTGGHFSSDAVSALTIQELLLSSC